MMPVIDLSRPGGGAPGFEQLLVAISIEIPGAETLEIDDRTVAGWEGDPEVPVRVYRPKRRPRGRGHPASS